VSVAVLARVRLADTPGGASGPPLLALEHRATRMPVVNPLDPVRVDVHAQPFGGAIRVLDQARLRDALGEFQFDSERSREEEDFRLLIRPEAWGAVQQFCRAHFAAGDPCLDSDPARELAEEFADALGINLMPAQYQARPVGALVATQLVPSLSRRAAGMATARIYRLFEVTIVDAALARAIAADSQAHTDDDLRQRALLAGNGRANAVLALPLAALTQAYLALPPVARAAPLMFQQHRLDANVPAVLAGVPLPDFQPL
jgi:hypothetical protein